MMRYALFFLLASLCTFAAAQDTLRVQVHGMVVDANTEVPLLETLVEWYDENGQRQAVNQTNSAGKYAFFLRTTGEVELRVEENGYAPYREKLRILAGESAREFTIRLVAK